VIELPAFRVGVEAAAHELSHHYGLVGRVTELGSQQDANFRVETRSGESFVLKLANPGTAEVELLAQHEAMRRVAARTEVSVPRSSLAAPALRCTAATSTASPPPCAS
jgi:Ser/Thr protein kinase RdoA (MazF antagonist)